MSKKGGERSVQLRWPAFRRPVVRWGGWGSGLGRLPSGDGLSGHNLRWFRLDGVFAQASESIVLAYLTLFVLSLGATRAQIGLMSALASLSAALLLFPGAAMADRWGRRKALVLLSGGGTARLVLLSLALVPWLFGGPTALRVAILLVVVRGAFANLGVPAWISLTADIVPLSLRGRYFAARNIAMAIAGVVTTYSVGQLITRLGDPIGYQVALLIAFGIGLAATFSFSRIREPVTRAPSARMRSPRLALFRRLGAHREFLVFCALAALWNGSLGIAGPFFSVHMVENLGASASVVGTLDVLATLAALPGQRLFGRLVDRWGPRRVQVITGLIIPFVPWGWALTRSAWHLAPLQVASGFLWAGYGLANFNFLLLLVPEEGRSHYTALYQFAATLALAGGALLGGVVASRWGMMSVFVITGVGRLAAATLFAVLVRQPASETGVPRRQGRARQRAAHHVRQLAIALRRAKG